MKKAFLSVLALSLCISSFAQWNNTGDCKTTGDLYVGNPADNTYSKLVLRGPNAPANENSKRDFMFEFKDSGSSIIRGARTGGYGTTLEFLTNVGYYTPERRLFLSSLHQTIFYDPTVKLGEYTNGLRGEGTKLVFAGTEYADKEVYIQNYMHTNRFTDLRVCVGANGGDRFVVGGGNGTFNELFSVDGNGNVGIGTVSNTYKLEVNGTIRAKEVRVESGWADFVFKPDYQLPTLQEVKAHIDEHKHLPGMPSEAEVQENGVGLAEATTKLLQKVEELTLYAIQQQETIEKLTKEVNELKNDKK